MSLRRPKIQIKPKVSIRSVTKKTSADNTCKQSSDPSVKTGDTSAKEPQNVDQTIDEIKSSVITTKVIAVIDNESDKHINENNVCNEETSLEINDDLNATKLVVTQQIVSEHSIQSNEIKANKVSETDPKPQKVTETKSKTKSESNRKRKISRSGQKSDKTMRMKDLLLYNPPLTDEQKEMRDKDVEQTDIPTEEQPLSPKISESEDKSVKEDSNCGPRVKVGTDGLLILDEESVVVKRRKSEVTNESPLLESAVTTSALTNYSSFRSKSKSSSKPRWTEHETIRFYSALNTIGTDFTLMANLFFRGKRTRLDLRNKFKKEERINQLMIDSALLSQNNFINQCPELDDLLDDFSDSDGDTEDQIETNKQKSTKSK